MLILLPPSESKAIRKRGGSLDLSTLSFPELTTTRERVAAALAHASARPDAADTLGVSPNLTAEIQRNTVIETAPTLTGADLYTGVLYDALDLASMDAASLRRARRWVVIQSALYGAVRLRDRLAPYRASMSVSLHGVGPLASAWRPVLDEPMTAAAGKGLVLDARSSTYAAAWRPSGDVASRWVHIRVPGATHMAKHTRGLVTRAVCIQGLDPRRPAQLAEGLAQEFDVELTAPARTGAPWMLDVIPR